jgi:hypothetical protein
MRPASHQNEGLKNMGQLRTANKRHNRTLAKAVAASKPAAAVPAAKKTAA